MGKLRHVKLDSPVHAGGGSELPDISAGHTIDALTCFNFILHRITHVISQLTPKAQTALNIGSGRSHGHNGHHGNETHGGDDAEAR